MLVIISPAVAPYSLGLCIARSARTVRVSPFAATALLTYELERKERTCGGASLNFRKHILFSNTLNTALTYSKRNVVQQLPAITNRLFTVLREPIAPKLDSFDKFICILNILKFIRCESHSYRFIGSVKRILADCGWAQERFK